MPPIAQVKVNELTLKNGSNLLSSYSNGTYLVNSESDVTKDFKAIIFNEPGKIARLRCDGTDVLADYVQNIGIEIPAKTVIVAQPGVTFDYIKLSGGSVTLVL